ncbi:acetyl-CoA C-acetyltransferase [Rubeoparvulum massiliense]|uniref:acetyl-CoA C-acetyltransferase n=1 Tax=Rubeoparvulum massiliense TaxID=1631346 RepID=UPI00065DEBAB|nr:acetyl-CoA C-acetyltransferase [Rubeoparvulum massiliense]
MLRDVVIVSAKRTPIGRFAGQLASLTAPQLGAKVIEAVLHDASVAGEHVDEVILGHVLQAGVGQGPARQAALQAGLPTSVPSYAVNKLCGSGLKAVHLGWQAIACGEAEIVVAGGMESMSNAPYLLPGARHGYRMGDQQVQDSMLQDGLHCAINQYHMGVTAENIAARYGLSREEQDQFALASQQKAATAQKNGRFQAEILPLTIPQRKGDPIHLQIDESPRNDTTLAKLMQLPSVFQKDGTVTAGNASGINDGAAALLLMSREEARKRGLTPLAVIRGFGRAGVDPALMGLGPIPASKLALERAGIQMDQIDLVEANEAFAAQALAVIRDLQLDPEIVNVNGGAIALGHPIGASGARIFVTLLHEMARRDSRYGLATLCIGGGQGIAAVVERERS